MARSRLSRISVCCENRVPLGDRTRTAFPQLPSPIPLVVEHVSALETALETAKMVRISPYNWSILKKINQLSRFEAVETYAATFPRADWGCLFYCSFESLCRKLFCPALPPPASLLLFGLPFFSCPFYSVCVPAPYLYHTPSLSQSLRLPLHVSPTPINPYSTSLASHSVCIHSIYIPLTICPIPCVFSSLPLSSPLYLSHFPCSTTCTSYPLFTSMSLPLTFYVPLPTLYIVSDLGNQTDRYPELPMLIPNF